MEKYEFKTKQPLWIWVTAIILVGCVLVYAINTGNYVLVVIWGLYYIFALVNAHRVYTITPDRFVMKQGLSKPRFFLLENISEIEKKYTKDQHLKAVIVRYSDDDKHHNFFEIKKFDTDVEGILHAILDYRPSVPVH